MNQDFEIFAKEFSEYFMRNYFIPWIKQKGVVFGYRARIVSKDTSNKTMVISRPLDATQISVPYANSAENLMINDMCVVLCLGESSNCVVIADSQFNMFNGNTP